MNEDLLRTYSWQACQAINSLIECGASFEATHAAIVRVRDYLDARAEQTAPEPDASEDFNDLLGV